MLIYYRFNNFCSFNCESEFSMSAPAGKVKKRFPVIYVETAEGFDLLKSAVIVGENAGGKSNFINSIKYLKSLSQKKNFSHRQMISRKLVEELLFLLIVLMPSVHQEKERCVAKKLTLLHLVSMLLRI